MIYEMRTYTLKPGSVGKWEELFAEAYGAGRDKYSKLGGLWHTELGPLNQVIHIWPYESLQHRADVRAKSARGWESGRTRPPVSWSSRWRHTGRRQGHERLGRFAAIPGEVYELRTHTYALATAPRAWPSRGSGRPMPFVRLPACS
jgi:hypothetical protein